MVEIPWEQKTVTLILDADTGIFISVTLRSGHSKPLVEVCIP